MKKKVSATLHLSMFRECVEIQDKMVLRDHQEKGEIMALKVIQDQKETRYHHDTYINFITFSVQCVANTC